MRIGIEHIQALTERSIISPTNIGVDILVSAIYQHMLLLLSSWPILTCLKSHSLMHHDHLVVVTVVTIAVPCRGHGQSLLLILLSHHLLLLLSTTGIETDWVLCRCHI